VHEKASAAVSASTVDELHALGYLGAADAGSATDVPEPSLLPDPKDKIEQQKFAAYGDDGGRGGETEKAPGRRWRRCCNWTEAQRWR